MKRLTPPILTLDQVADLLGLAGEKGARRWLDKHAPELRHPIGRRVYVMLDELEEFVRRQEDGAEDLRRVASRARSRRG